MKCNNSRSGAHVITMDLGRALIKDLSTAFAII
jgi:hypothetical protein